MPVQKKIVLSRAYGIFLIFSLFLFGTMVGWQLYKYTNEYLGYTSGVTFYELTFDFMVNFFKDFDTPQLKLALIGGISAIILSWVKVFRTRKK